MEITLAVVLSLAAAAGVVLVRERRHRRRIRALMVRLEALEAEHLVVEVIPVGGGAGAAPGERVGEEKSAEADVLSGRTTHIQRLVQSSGDPPENLADRVILCVHEKMEEALKPGDIARELFVSLRTLERGLASSLGCTPRQLILAMKMREAKKLLTEKRLTVSETSNRLGFSSPGHFSRRFTAFFSRPPSTLFDR